MKYKLNYTKETYKSRAEWLKARGIGGSDAAAIVGVSKWTTIKDIIKRIVNGDFSEKKKNSRMENGTNKEPFIRGLFKYNNEGVYKVIEPPKRGFWLFRRRDNPLITCTPDGILINNNKQKFGLEIKDVGIFRASQYEEWENGHIPNNYYVQILHYLVTMNDLVGVKLYAHIMFYEKNEESGKWEYSNSFCRTYTIYREDVQKDIDYLEKKEFEFIEKLNNKEE